MIIALVLPAFAGRMAVTVDDLPWQDHGPRDVARAGDAPRRLVEALTSRGVPAVGFVNSDRVDDPALVRAWTDAGLELGNHGASHQSLSRLGLDAWLGDARRCDTWLRAFGPAPRWFRYPYLHQGDTVEKRDGAYAGLAAMGYRVAHVSIDTMEWRLAAVYTRALADGDPAGAAAIGAEFTRHLVDASAHYAELARRKVGRDVDHVLLLHAHALGADHLGAALDALAAAGWGWVTLETALADPVYALPDVYTSTYGPSWLHRIAPTAPDDLDWEQRVDREYAERFRVR